MQNKKKYKEAVHGLNRRNNNKKVLVAIAVGTVETVFIAQKR